MSRRSISIIKMNIEDYMEDYKEEYEEGNLFDYPLEEMEHILKDTESEYFALIDYRLYELEDIEDDEFIEVAIEEDEDIKYIYKQMKYKYGLASFPLSALPYIMSMEDISYLLLDGDRLCEVY